MFYYADKLKYVGSFRKGQEILIKKKGETISTIYNLSEDRTYEQLNVEINNKIRNNDLVRMVEYIVFLDDVEKAGESYQKGDRFRLVNRERWDKDTWEVAIRVNTPLSTAHFYFRNDDRAYYNGEDVCFAEIIEIPIPNGVKI